MTQEFQHGARRLAYNLAKGRGPGVVFLGGFRSDKEGTKALHLEAWARKHDRAFLRFDYSGHGTSSGAFEDGCVGDWFADAAAIIAELTTGPQILVGSSMGGWIALLLARAMPESVAGMVAIAAAPDFTEDGLWASFDKVQRARIASEGRVEVPSRYGDGPYVITRELIEDGRKHLVLRTPLNLPFPVRFLHGTDDTDVGVSTAYRLLAHSEGEDIRLTVVKNADHRFSSSECLDLIVASFEEVSRRSAR